MLSIFPGIVFRRIPRSLETDFGGNGGVWRAILGAKSYVFEGGSAVHFFSVALSGNSSEVLGPKCFATVLLRFSVCLFFPRKTRFFFADLVFLGRFFCHILRSDFCWDSGVFSARLSLSLSAFSSFSSGGRPGCSFSAPLLSLPGSAAFPPLFSRLLPSLSLSFSVSLSLSLACKH